MKLKPDYVLREVAGSWIVLPLNEDVLNFHGMLTLNRSGVLLWKELEKGSDRESLADALMEVYDVARNQALADVDGFLEKLTHSGCLAEE